MAKKQATLKIYGDIGEPMVEMVLFGGEDSTTVSAKMVSDWIDTNADAEELIVRINSRGGDVQEGWAIYDLLTGSGKKITTIGDGKVYSIATIVFLAGSTRKMLKNADGLIHNPFIPPYTLADAYESADLLKLAEGLVQEEEKILEFYAAQTGTPVDKLATFMRNETKLSAEDMLELGFATEIVEPIKAFAYFKPTKTSKEMTSDTEKKSILAKFNELVSAFSRLNIKNQEFTDANGNVFKIDKEAGAPAIGDTAQPDGEFTMADGTKITIAGGVITEIEQPMVEETEEMQAIKAENEQLRTEIAALRAAQTEAENAKAAAEAAKAAYDAKETQIVAMIADMEKLKNEWQPAARGTVNASTTPGGVDLDRVNQVLRVLKNQAPE